MIGTIFVSSYLISCGYNYVMLNHIRKDVQSECRTKLLNSGFQIVDKQFDSILECSKIVDDVVIGMLSFLPFANLWMSYRNMTGKTKTRYY